MRTNATYEIICDDVGDLGGEIAFETWRPGYRLLVIEGKLLGQKRANVILSRAEARRLIRQMQRIIDR